MEKLQLKKVGGEKGSPEFGKIIVEILQSTIYLKLNFVISGSIFLVFYNGEGIFLERSALQPRSGSSFLYLTLCVCVCVWGGRGCDSR